MLYLLHTWNSMEIFEIKEIMLVGDLHNFNKGGGSERGGGCCLLGGENVLDKSKLLGDAATWDAVAYPFIIK